MDWKNIWTVLKPIDKTCACNMPGMKVWWDWNGMQSKTAGDCHSHGPSCLMQKGSSEAFHCQSFHKTPQRTRCTTWWLTNCGQDQRAQEDIYITSRRVGLGDTRTILWHLKFWHQNWKQPRNRRAPSQSVVHLFLCEPSSFLFPLQRFLLGDRFRDATHKEILLN